MRHRTLLTVFALFGSIAMFAGPSLGAPKKGKKKPQTTQTAAPAATPAPAPAPTTAAATTGSATASLDTTATNPATTPAPPAYAATTPAPETSSEAASAHSMPPPFTLEKTSLSAGVEYGSNNLNFGLGARGGYTIAQHVYIGGLFDYWFGTSEDVSIPGTTFHSSASAHAWDLMANAGYDFGITPNIVVRPFGGFGLVHAFGSVCAPNVVTGGEDCADTSATRGAGVLGGQGIMNFGMFNVSAELRLLIESDSAVVLALHGGGMF